MYCCGSCSSSCQSRFEMAWVVFCGGLLHFVSSFDRICLSSWLLSHHKRVCFPSLCLPFCVCSLLSQNLKREVEEHTRNTWEANEALCQQDKVLGACVFSMLFVVKGCACVKVCVCSACAGQTMIAFCQAFERVYPFGTYLVLCAFWIRVANTHDSRNHRNWLQS